MKTLTLLPSPLSGELSVPPSKSFAHRALLAAALSHGQSQIHNLEMSADITATMSALICMGAKAQLSAHGNGRLTAEVTGIEKASHLPDIDCKESGSTLRFMIPVSLALCGGATFYGDGRLGKRPLLMQPYIDQGIKVFADVEGLPLKLVGHLRGDDFTLPGNISSQFITGLLFASPLLREDSLITLTGKTESRGYIDITLQVLHDFGIEIIVQEDPTRFSIKAMQPYQNRSYTVEGDWSQAAFLLVMGLLGDGVTIHGLNEKSCQGDRAIVEILRQMGGDISWQGDCLVARPSVLQAAEVDVSQCPDLTPAIAAAMALAKGQSRVVGGARLKDKESHRIQSICGCLSALGADMTATDDGMVVVGKDLLDGGSCDACGDHRIAMMAASVSCKCRENLVLSGADSVNKSWPTFWHDFGKLGGKFDG